jgi:hypothetical protein
MPSLAEVARAIYGAWRLMLFDPGGMAHFDFSISGYWRSFFAAVVVAPAYVLFVVVGLSAAEAEPVDPAWVAMVKGGAYLISWVVFPAAAILVTRLLGVTGRYIPLIVAYNWSNVPPLLILLPVELLAASGSEIGATMGTFALLFILVYEWFVVRVALDVPPFTAVGIVVLDVLLGLMIQMSATSLL